MLKHLVNIAILFLMFNMQSSFAKDWYLILISANGSNEDRVNEVFKNNQIKRGNSYLAIFKDKKVVVAGPYNDEKSLEIRNELIGKGAPNSQIIFVEKNELSFNNESKQSTVASQKNTQPPINGVVDILSLPDFTNKLAVELNPSRFKYGISKVSVVVEADTNGKIKKFEIVKQDPDDSFFNSEFPRIFNSFIQKYGLSKNVFSDGSATIDFNISRTGNGQAFLRRTPTKLAIPEKGTSAVFADNTEREQASKKITPPIHDSKINSANKLQTNETINKRWYLFVCFGDSVYDGAIQSFVYNLIALHKNENHTAYASMMKKTIGMFGSGECHSMGFLIKNPEGKEKIDEIIKTDNEVYVISKSTGMSGVSYPVVIETRSKNSIHAKEHEKSKVWWDGFCVGEFAYGISELKMKPDQFGTDANSKFIKYKDSITRISKFIDQCKAGKKDLTTQDSCNQKLTKIDNELWDGFWLGHARGKTRSQPSELTLDTGSICSK